MRTALPTLTLLALAFVATGFDAGADTETTLRTRVQELVEMMATGDGASRTAASDEMAKLGRAAVPHVSRFTGLISDAGGRDALAGALARIGLDDAIALLQAYPSQGSPKGRPQLRELLGVLRSMRAQRDPKLAMQVDLVPAPASNVARVPPDAEFEIGDALPEALAWGEFAARKSKAAIQVDVEGTRVETVEAERPRCLRVGPGKRPILVYRRFDRWYAASGALLTGRSRSEEVELWDADLDGTFTGPRDFVRFADGAFQRIPEDGLVMAPQGLATMTVKSTESGATVTLIAEPLPPDMGQWTLNAVSVLNEWRRGVGLPPLLLNLVRCAACAKHVDYWRLNGYSGHDETADRPGYSAEGAQAGRKSSVWDTPDAAKLARVITATVLHRASCLGAAGEGLGIANGAGTCIWGGDLDATGRGFPVLVPGPGQETVPATCESELPPPDRDANFYAQARGYPVTVLWRALWADVTGARIELHATGPGGVLESVAGESFVPDHPYSDKGRAIETASATFVAAKPLERRKSYVARFRCDRKSGPVEFTWAFSTR